MLGFAALTPTYLEHAARVHLTPIEYRLISVLAANVGKAMTYRSLVGAVWVGWGELAKRGINPAPRTPPGRGHPTRSLATTHRLTEYERAGRPNVHHRRCSRGDLNQRLRAQLIFEIGVVDGRRHQSRNAEGSFHH